MSRVIVVGDIVTDVLAVYDGQLAVGSDTPARIQLTAGGSAANTAAWLAWAGCPVTLVAVVGDDPAGVARRAELAASGVDSAVRVAPGAVTGSVVVLSEPRERTMLCDRGANSLLSIVDIEDALSGAPDAVHLHLSGYALFDGASRPAGRHALAAAAARGLTTSVDAASANPLRRVGGAVFLDWVRAADLLLANLDEARALLDSEEPAPELAAALAARARHAVVKLGADGALWAYRRPSSDSGRSGVAGSQPSPETGSAGVAGSQPSPGTDSAGVAGRDATTIRVAAQPAVLADPTGAGDAFAAGLLASWLSGTDPAQALAAGARLGAQAVSQTGARPAR